MSKGSKYFENEERKEAFITRKIENMRARCANLSATDMSNYQMVADKRILELEATHDLLRIWLHIDMDTFYAAVETLDNPSLRSQPMAVGSKSTISTANYEMYDPNLMAASLVEAYLDITEVCKERDITCGEIAEELRTSVYKATDLTCGAGVAPNRLLAKVCSDTNKPSGQFVLPGDWMAVMTFISSLPIRKLSSDDNSSRIRCLNDQETGDNAYVNYHLDNGFLTFSRCSIADFFISVGLGLGKTDRPQARFRKSISNERTFSATNDSSLLYQKLAELAEMLAIDMQ